MMTTTTTITRYNNNNNNDNTNNNYNNNNDDNNNNNNNNNNKNNNNNANDIREEMKRRINIGNACHYSSEKILSSCLLFKKLKIKRPTYKTTILSVVCMVLKFGLSP